MSFIICKTLKIQLKSSTTGSCRLQKHASGVLIMHIVTILFRNLFLQSIANLRYGWRQLHILYDHEQYRTFILSITENKLAPCRKLYVVTCEGTNKCFGSVIWLAAVQYDNLLTFFNMYVMLVLCSIHKRAWVVQNMAHFISHKPKVQKTTLPPTGFN
jgi:hypothetical protein